jgi:hypothetical protein
MLKKMNLHKGIIILKHRKIFLSQLKPKHK